MPTPPAEPVLVLGGGSNVVAADEGFDGTVVQVATTGVGVDADGCDDSPPAVEWCVTVAAGESWDDARATLPSSRTGSGSRRCPGIPGSVGATPIQNVGAYGQEVAADHRVGAHLGPRATARMRTFATADCGFGYRHSRFKAEPGRYVVLERDLPAAATARCRRRSRYAELARRSGSRSAAGHRSPRSATPCSRCAAARAWCSTPPTTTPGAPARSSPTRCSRRPTPRGCPPTRPAGRSRDGTRQDQRRLADRARRLRARATAAGRCRLSTKHTLALTNRGGATTADLLALAREIRDGVAAAYGVRLVPEPVLVGVEL